jgi:hypothetical protein
MGALNFALHLIQAYNVGLGKIAMKCKYAALSVVILVTRNGQNGSR